MKIPCELIVWYVLPMIRREMADELVTVHNMSQAEVARKFDVTDAAVSQYIYIIEPALYLAVTEFNLV